MRRKLSRDRLGFFEDYFHRGPFLANVTFYFGLVLVASRLVRRVRMSSPGAGRRERLRQ